MKAETPAPASLAAHTPMMHGRKARDFIAFSGAVIDDLHCHLHLPDEGELAEVIIGHVLAIAY
jgi:hypothetical protein